MMPPQDMRRTREQQQLRNERRITSPPEFTATVLGSVPTVAGLA